MAHKKLKLPDGDAHHVSVVKPQFSVFNRKQIRKQKKEEKKTRHIQANMQFHEKKHFIEKPKQEVNPEVQARPVRKVIQKQPPIPKQPKIDKRQLELQKQIDDDEKEIQQLQAKLGLKENKLSRRMILEEGHDNDLFEFLDHIDTQARNKNFVKGKYVPYQPLNDNDQGFIDQEDDESEGDAGLVDSDQDVALSDVDEDDDENEDVEPDLQLEESELDDEQKIDEESQPKQKQTQLQKILQDQQANKKLGNQRIQTSQEQRTAIQDKIRQNENLIQTIVKVKPILKQEKQNEAVITQAVDENVQNNNVANDEQSLEIRKQLNRNINKLSEANINLIANEIIKIFEENPKQLVSQILAQILIQSIVKVKQLLSYLLSCITVVCCHLHQLYDNICFAEFLKQIIIQLKSNGDPLEAKHITLLFCHFYLFESISIDFIKEYVSYVCENIDGDSVENLINIVQYCGKKIRSDNPQILKQLIDEVREAVEKKGTDSKSSHLLATMNDLRLNKKISSQSERLDFLMNWQKGRQTKLIAKAFPVGFSQCMKSEFKNNCWWKPIVTNEEQTELYKEFAIQRKDCNLKLLESRAIEQKMITDTRKAIFIIVMGADDLFEASQNLIKLGYLKKKKQDTALVIVEMCGNETSYNPYYSALAQNLVALEKSMKQQFQYALWDKFKLMTEYSQRKQLNLSRFTAELLKFNSISLLTLKWFELDTATQNVKSFVCAIMKYFLSKIKLEVLAKQCKNLFENSDYLPFRTSLQHLLKNDFKHSLKSEDKNYQQIIKDSRLMIKLLQEEEE